MTGACMAPSDGGGFITSFSGFIDCRAEVLDTSAFGALSAPGSAFSTMLVGLLTIFVALIGYNLLFGRGLNIRTGTMLMVRVGIVLTLVSSWPAYQTLVYDVAVQGPAQLASEIGRAAAMPGSDGTLLQRLDAADGALQQLAILGPGQVDFSQAQAIAPPPMAGFDAFALGGSRILFLFSALTAIVSVRIVAALMLALGPYFVTMLLFEQTRSLFEGWVRVLCGAALAAIGVWLCLGFELAWIEPWLGNVLSRRAGGEALPTVPTELFVTICFFAAAIAVSAFASIKLASSFRFSRALQAVQSVRVDASGGQAALAARTAKAARSSEPPSRAALMANAVASLQRRESGGYGQPGDVRVAARSYGRLEGGAAAPPHGINMSTGRTFPRRTKLRSTSSSARRDGVR